VRRIADAALTGVLGAVRRIHTSRGGGLVTIVFREGGAAPFFDLPLNELYGHTLALDDVLPRRELAPVCDALGEARDHAARVAIVERFLLSRRRYRAIDPLVRVAAATLREARGDLRVGDLADRLDIGQDALEKRFRRAVGATPKQMARLHRVAHAVELAKAGASWSSAAFTAGYFDQAHFIGDFRALAGMPPARFFREVESC
jgi:AraC-like DNA-binding protein